MKVVIAAAHSRGRVCISRCGPSISVTLTFGSCDVSSRLRRELTTLSFNARR